MKNSVLNSTVAFSIAALIVVAGCSGSGSDGGVITPTAVDPTGEWALTHTLNLAESDCPITIRWGVVVPGVPWSQATVPLPLAPAQPSDVEFNLNANENMLFCNAEDEGTGQCEALVFAYDTDTATLQASDDFIDLPPITVAVPGLSWSASCTYTPAELDVTIAFATENECGGTTITRGELVCSPPSGLVGVGLTGGNDNCSLVFDVAGQTCDDDCVTAC